MILFSVDRANGKSGLRFELRQPAIYLDHCAVIDISESKKYSDRFFNTFKSKGTLCVSWLSFLEIAQNSGQSHSLIQNFIRNVGPHWLPLEMNPYQVMLSEKKGLSGFDAAVSSELASFYGAHLVNSAKEDLEDFVSWTQSDVFQAEVRPRFEMLKAELWDKSLKLGKLANLNKIDENSFEYIFRGLLKVLSKQSCSVENDSIDLLHASIGIGYCDFVVLDKKWKELVGQVLPSKKQYVYSCSPKDLDRFLGEFDNCEIS